MTPPPPVSDEALSAPEEPDLRAAHDGLGARVELLGARIRAARVARGIGVRELARRVDCSGSLISQIERGRVNPSVSTLYAISTALEISIDALFASEPVREAGGDAAETVIDALRRLAERGASARGDPLVLLRPAQRRVVNLAGGVQWRLLTPAPERDAEFMEVVYAPGGGSTKDEHAIRHTGREYSLILEGVLAVQVGFGEYRLGPGDSMAFDSTIPHRFWNPGPLPVRGVWFVVGRWSTPSG